jgi:hypothetical protein
MPLSVTATFLDASAATAEFLCPEGTRTASIAVF